MRLTGLWWWIDRWRKSTAYTGMSLEEQGAYRNLLDEASLRGGPLPNDEEVLAKACGDPRRWRRVRAKVMVHFTLTADGWRNETLDEVLKESERRATNQANYRQRRNNKPDNKPDNKRASPDPDPIVDPTDLHKELRVEISPTEETLAMRAGGLVERYAELFYKFRRGARYHSRIHLDFQKAQQLVKTWPDDTRLDKLAEIVLTTDDEWISGTDRGFGVFAAKASWADDRLAAWEVEHGFASGTH